MTASTENQGLPSARPVELTPNVTLQPALSRRGQGPALMLIRPSCYSECKKNNSSLDPEPLQKWAEESFVVAQVTLDSTAAGDPAAIGTMVQTAKEGLTTLPERTSKDQCGVISGFSVRILPSKAMCLTGTSLRFNDRLCSWFLTRPGGCFGPRSDAHGYRVF